MLNATLKYTIQATVTLLLTVAFLITSIRRFFWLCITVPATGVFAWKLKPKGTGTLIIAAFATLLLIYQPNVKLPSASFIGFADQIEDDLDEISIRSHYTTETLFKYLVKDTEPVTGDYGKAFEFFGDNTSTPVRPPQGSNKAVNEYFYARGAAPGENYITADVGAELMVNKFPFEPIPRDTSSFTVWTYALSDIGSHGHLPYPKHVIIILFGFAVYTLASSYLFSSILRRIFR